MTLRTRKPSGRPSWPLILLAGVEGSGKTWSAAEATGISMVGSAWWIEIGEQMADEYIKVPGADFEIIDHDGTYRNIAEQIREAAAAPTVDGKPNMLVVDSMTELWDLLSGEQQEIANRKRGNKTTEAPITMDQWNAAKKRWNQVIDALRSFPGPVILTSRLESVAVVGPDGKPVQGASSWKIRAEKNLPYEVQVVMQAQQPRHWTMTKVASTQLIMPPVGVLPWPEFTVEELLIRMGLDQIEVSTKRTYVRTQTAPEPRVETQVVPASDWPEDIAAAVKELEEAGDLDGLTGLWHAANQRGARTVKARVEAAADRVKQRKNVDAIAKAKQVQIDLAAQADEEAAVIDAWRESELAARAEAESQEMAAAE